MTRSTGLTLRDFRAPRFWPTWILLGIIRAASRVPPAWQVRIGAALGWLLGVLKPSERRIAARNLEVCFPELAPAARHELVKRHLRSVGLSIVEMGIGWYTPLAELRRRVEVRGLEHLERAMTAGNGALLYTAHFTPIEVGVAVLEEFKGTVNSMYRPQRNAMMDYLILAGRRRFADKQIRRDNVRELIRSLKRNEAVLYMPDQTYLGNQSALISFFGEPAMTNTATSKLARISGAPVIPYFFRRNPDDETYTVTIGAPLEDFPGDDPIADTRRLVALLEQRIRETPEQYLWIYKKFKRRPDSFGDIYAEPER